MVPIQDVLHRIRWDPACRGRFFEVGYLDRVAGGVVRVPLGTASLDAGPGAALTVRDGDGAVRRVPLHRVREVWEDGCLIWARGGSAP